MIQDELNQRYKKLISFIEREISDELLKNVQKQLNNSAYNLEEQIDYCIRNYGMPIDSNLRKRNIEQIIEDGIYPLKKKLTQYRDLMTDACKEFYTGLLDVVQRAGTKEEKFKLAQRYIDGFNEKARSILRKSQNEEIEFYDELDTYFRRNLGDDNFYYEIKDHLKRDQNKFVNFYGQSIDTLMKSTTKLIGEDIQNLVVPHIQKEAKLAEEKQKEQVEVKQNENTDVSSNTSVEETKAEKTNTFDYDALAKKYANKNSFFDAEIKQFVQIIESITNKEVKFLFGHNLSMKLYTSWLDSKNEIEIYSNKIIDNIAMMYQMKQENRILESNKLLDNYSAYIENYKQKDYANNGFGDAVELIINSNSLNQQEIDNLRKLADEYKTKYNLFIQSKINDMYNKSLETVKRHFDINYSNDAKEEIEVKKEINNPAVETTVEKVSEPVEVVETTKEEVKEENKNQIDSKIENKNKNFLEGTKQFVESIKGIINKDVHFLKRHDLDVKLSDIWFKQVREIDDFSHKTLIPIAEMYQMRKESLVDDANLLLENYSIFIQNCKQKDYSNGAFHDFVNEIMNDNFSNQEEIDALIDLADEYKKQYNLFIYNKIDAMYKDTLEKANRHFGISYLSGESEELEENKGHKI